ncbi:nucleoside-diphosphate-sugar epimerase [Nocardiopsis sp. Huas11]|uniref:SDR family oxidoreductase n=1 Tax=Nocardiopsis sp. Huas11 TaxID=2183912 RepID=UPI000EB24652|nr:SDR family oxidoreductase [Nocardiopsis sp. Huas11]RKS06992.1 nucleoside-diphosphate-sugar epimerase [Nocardiopsis sp. Huas11]
MPPLHAAPNPQTLVLGSTGLIGRRLVAELLHGGQAVAAGTRGDRGEAALLTWLGEHAVPTARLTTVHVELGRPDLGLGLGLGLGGDAARRLRDVRDVYNCAGLYRFGLSREEARAANVDSALHALTWASRLSSLRRAVHVTGYRASGVLAAPPTPAEAGRLYRDRGAYEAAKIEADALVRDFAVREGVPLSIVNPATVIGDSETGEAGQYIGLARTVRDLWRGRLPLLPGGPSTFVPVVTVDHLARFLAAVPVHDSTETEDAADADAAADGRGSRASDPARVPAHWVLDDGTPALHDLLRGLAAHLDVRAPRGRVPVGLLRRLPRALTGVEPETLSFLSDDRYDTASADALTRAAGLTPPPVWPSLTRWADRLVAEDFGERAVPAARP